MWIIPSNHPLYSRYAQACVASKEELKELCNDSLSMEVIAEKEPFNKYTIQSELPLMWKSKLLSSKIWYNKWNRVYWLPHLFGRTLKPSHGKSFEDEYTASLAVIRANHFPQRGYGGGANDPRHLWPFIKCGVKKSRPDWVFFENVEGHLSLGFERVQKDLRKMGYVVEAGVFTAQEVGAPHKRARLFILGVENSVLQRMRRGDNEQRENREREIQATRSSELADTNNRRVYDSSRGNEKTNDGEWLQQRNINQEFSESGELANDNSEGQSQQKGIIKEVRARISDISQPGNGMAYTDEQRSEEKWPLKEQREATHSGTSGDGTKVYVTGVGQADSCDIDVQRHVTEQPHSKGWEESGERQAGSQGVDRWPSGPAENQYDWEAPRVESSVGYAINGYNFREDLLRMAGNGVVEQTAELAFRTLLQKHGLNY